MLQKTTSHEVLEELQETEDNFRNELLNLWK
jgi:hypothetical protein